MVYENGVMFLNGEDKGQALSCILSSTKQPIKTILFVDDAIKNTQAVHDAFVNRNDVNVINILYTKENSKEDDIQKNTPLQAQLVDEWKHLKNSLNTVIKQPTI